MLLDRRQHLRLVTVSCSADSYCPMSGHSWPSQFSNSINSSDFLLGQTSSDSYCFGMILARIQAADLNLKVSPLSHHPQSSQPLSDQHTLRLCRRPSDLDGKVAGRPSPGARITGRSLSPIPSRHSPTSTFRPQRRPCKCSLRNSYRLSGCPSSSSAHSTCGKDLLRQTGRSSHY